eukprot:TRINITY_DN98133_c0_g1_i1.p1 TRINITY_DN98133_c0_g1~~TRINITY_DN98133_c0_g1_i1.p1  ORF type:complete len:252 (-),score=44.45 TRINITY_DN98133_c0_g1_i1:122-817(-)
MVSDSMKEALDMLTKEIKLKADQARKIVNLNKAMSRQELAEFCWKTGRITQKLVNPTVSGERAIFWQECKGILKQVLNLEAFNPSQFHDECVRQDILEDQLSKMLDGFLSYVQKRANGQIKAPSRLMTAEEIKLAEIEKAKEQEYAEWEGNGKDGKGGGKKRKDGWWEDGNDSWDANWWSVEKPRKKAREFVLKPDTPMWGDDSDPDEECPDIMKFGKCSYGTQCGFCNRE